MAAVYLHIGLPKTGTTAVQSLLWNNKPVLERHGICYPDVGLRYPHIPRSRNAYFLTRHMGPDYEAVLGQLAEYGKRFDRIFLTEETLYRFWAYQPDKWRRFKEDLAAKGLELYVILYLRRQDNFILSMYRQRVKSTSTGDTFYGHLKELSKLYPLDYPAYMDMLSDTIGREFIFLRVYEDGQYRGEEHNLLSDFLDIFGLSLADGFEVKQEMYNPTLDGSRFELQRVLNSLPSSPRDTKALAKSFKSLRNDIPYAEKPKKTSFFKPGEQSAYLESFAESNRRLAREYLGREDGILFYDDKDTELPEYEVDWDALLNDTILFYGRTVQFLEDEVEDLQKELTKLKKLRESSFFYRLKRKLRTLLGKSKTTEKDPEIPG